MMEISQKEAKMHELLNLMETLGHRKGMVED
jgi:hypothetical protein